MASGPGQPFSFTLKTNARTSAGVYQKDGTLIRTLWSGVDYKAGTYTQIWDGTDDEGHLAADGAYDIKVLSNNVTYTWEGVVGNTSTQLTGAAVHRGWEGIRAMATTGNTIYYAKGYSEGSSALSKFTTATPQTKTTVLPSSSLCQTTLFSATDGVNVYWAGYDAFAKPSNTSWFVFATKVADDSEYTFSKGTSLKMTNGRTYKSAIAVVGEEDAIVSGMAVQKNGNYLFVAYKYYNAIMVFNKTTGETVKALPISDAPGNIAIDRDDNLWVLLGTKAQKYTVKNDGSISASSTRVTGLSEALALAVSPDGNTLLVADGGESQQVKAFSTATASALWTYGKKGGYATDATVTTDKFYFKNEDIGRNTYLAFQSDGSFWIGDSGNFRALHYSASRSYIDGIMYMPTCYSTSVDANNPNRVFANFLEFAVDYSKPLAGTNDSWKLVRNWSVNVPSKYQDQYNILKQVATLSNGRTYASLKNNTGAIELVELVNGGLLRLTGVNISPASEGATTQLYGDGSLRRTYRVSIGQTQKFTHKALVGFDSNNNPQWASETTLATTPLATRQDPIYYGNQQKLRSGEMTSSNIVVAFDGGLTPYGSNGYHLGGIRLNDNKWLWRTATSTRKDYAGGYPADGAYDNGNGVNYSGSPALALDRSIIWGYHGEGWKNSQTNKWNHVYDNGLFLGQFGRTGPETGGQEAAAGMAGNSFCPSLVKTANGSLYLYHNDESWHSGIHRWKISGLNTIEEQVISVSLVSKNGGLMGYYFPTNDLNNLGLQTTRMDSQLDFNWGVASPVGADLPDASNYSVRWQGFVQPLYSERYSLSLTTDKGIRLWVDDSLYLDQWNNSSMNELSSSVTLQTGKRYAIRIDSRGGSNVKLCWSSASQSKQTIPTKALYPGATDELIKLDLLKGLGYGKVLANDQYGWKREPVVEDYSSSSSKWWQAVSGRKSYGNGSPDLWIKYRQGSGDYSVSRNLGTVSNASSWSLTGQISYEGNTGNVVGKGGCFVDVLDKDDKIIARTYVNIDYNGAGRPLSVFGNTVQLASDVQTTMQSILNRSQPLSIVASGSGISFSYAGFGTVSTKVFDASSNWRSPRSLRLSFYCNGRNEDRSITIYSMQFAAVTSGQSRKASINTEIVESRLSIYPNPSKAILNVDHAAVTNVGSLSIFTIDGKPVESYNISTGATSTSLDINSLPSGVYLLRYENGLDKASKRFIKE